MCVPRLNDKKSYRVWKKVTLEWNKTHHLFGMSSSSQSPLETIERTYDRRGTKGKHRGVQRGSRGNSLQRDFRVAKVSLLEKESKS